MTSTDPVLRTIIDANLYMVLATADESGRPWASPVYYAHADFHEFFWVSSPTSTHSRNLAVRPELGIVIFDSQVPISTGQGGCLHDRRGRAGRRRRARTGNGRLLASSLLHGGIAWTPQDVQGEPAIRLYRATVEEHSILAKDGQPDHRVPAHLR